MGVASGDAMRMTLTLVLLAFLLGAGVGDRYGLPGFARTLAAPAFSAVEGMMGGRPAALEPEEGRDPDLPGPAPAESGADLAINEAGLDIIRESEGLRLEAYRAGGQWLIGYGHSRTAREGMTITEAEADALLRSDVADSERAVRRTVKVPVNRNQFSAMVSLAYNLGAGGFSRSSVVERINAGDYAGAADAFLSHDRARIDGELRRAPHLTERRKKERALFLR